MSRPGSTRQTLMQVVAAAVRDFEEHGFDSEERLRYWEDAIRTAARAAMRSESAVREALTGGLRAVFDRLVNHGTVQRDHAGLPRFTLAGVAPRMHAQLSQRILASAQLIRLNREKVIAQTLQRFSGWASSVPAGGTDQADARKLRAEVARPLVRLPFVERRVLIDQGHKLSASISATLASDGGAIAARWFSHWRQANYDYREEHKERDGKVYLIRGSWAHRDGLVRSGPAGYSDEIDQPAEFPFCRCKFVFLYHLRQLPPEMLTAKGQKAMDKVRSAA